jgi:uncharacterized cofD-like protein
MAEKKLPWQKTLWLWVKKELRWLIPGIGVKRWIVVILAGTTLLGVGLAFILLDFYRTAPDTWWLPALSWIALRFLPRILRALIYGGVGIGLVVFGVWGLNRALLRPFVTPGTPIIDAVSNYRRRDRGPRIVVIGGGTGLSTLLRGLKSCTRNITALVTVADDGGSSGELRRNMGILPPGDIRNCLTALSDDEELLTQLFQYRFSDTSGLNGHSLGNLFISGLAEITGSFEEAVAESGRVLAVQGRVLPSTLTDVRLVADVELPNVSEKVRVKGESLIPQMAGTVKRVWLEPDHPAAYPPAVQAILAADLIIVGPGSLYTSILPNLLVTDLVNAIRASRALKFYVCNLATQPGETDGYSSADHLHTIERHVGGKIFDLVLCNENYDGVLPEGVDWVMIDDELDQSYPVYRTDLRDPEHPWRHDSAVLAQTIMDIFYDRTGPLNDRENQ